MFEITSKDIGTFEVTGKFFGVSMEKVELVFQVCHYCVGEINPKFLMFCYIPEFSPLIHCIGVLK